jgi:hypothetical protein
VRRRPVIALLFCCIIAFPLIFSGGLQTFQQYIKYTVDERLETEELVTLTIPFSKIQWMEEGREIMIDGRMFDIKSYVEKEGSLIATGVYDDRETAVMELLNNFNDKQQNSFIIQLLLLAQSFVVVLCLVNKELYFLNLLKHHSCFLIKRLQSFTQQFFTPPRRFFRYSH